MCSADVGGGTKAEDLSAIDESANFEQSTTVIPLNSILYRLEHAMQCATPHLAFSSLPASSCLAFYFDGTHDSARTAYLEADCIGGAVRQSDA